MGLETFQNKENPEIQEFRNKQADILRDLRKKRDSDRESQQRAELEAAQIKNKILGWGCSKSIPLGFEFL